MLKQKADEGVAVRIMIWDDETSLPVIRNVGLMRTHDEDALAYFIHTKVVCRLCPRLHPKSAPLFSHHQKIITVDTRSQINPGHREIMSFVGGLDLCDGRYDTEQHSLFHTLNTESHSDDFYQTSIAGACLNKGGPREPWHDAHACITGEAAWDVLTNFEQRWSKQCDPSLLVPTSTVSNLNRQSNSSTSSERNWKVQVFRSIDFLSVTQMLKNLTVEQSIHEAYVEAIRRAERFMYIENQYFIGGCHLWEKDKHSGCRNLIPIEIALKVVNKIKAKERFAVYIVIPMWPEGVPESDVVHDILHWTRETMSMMYKLIGEAIQESGEPGHPRDYLNFFCLANREDLGEGEFDPPHSPHPATQYSNAQKHRRFMVYVHSKLMIGMIIILYINLYLGTFLSFFLFFLFKLQESSPDGQIMFISLIWGFVWVFFFSFSPQFPLSISHRVCRTYVSVDDLYILIGSANINQRSMDGQRDTEIAIGCHQSKQSELDKMNRGDIHAYRMSLWFEHTGRAEESFREPQSLECVVKIRSIGDKMWNIYSGEEVVDMEGVHLVTYPVKVTQAGSVEDLETENGVHFPDTKTPVKGRRSILLPSVFTT